MKHNLTKKTNKLSEIINEEYQVVYKQLLETIHDEEYTKSEINYFIRKSIHHILKAQSKEMSVDEFTKKNKKKWAVEENKKYKDWHTTYTKNMKDCDRITYAGFLSMVAYSITLIVITAYTKGALTNWVWILLPGVITLALMLTKILFARRLKLPKLHIFGDIIMFALVTGVCYLSTIYFIIFLWVYEVAYMIYLQLHIVEEDL